MDYQDGNGEGLFGARNENSVLFSLDSLTAMENEQSGAGDGSFGSSGDASGLIDLNTLSKLSAGASVEGVGESNIMESQMFNEISTREKRRNMMLVVGLIVALILIAGGVIFWVLYSSKEDLDAANTKNQESLDAAKQENEALEEKLAKLEQANANLEADLKKRQANEKALQEARDKDKKALEAAGLGLVADSQNGDKPKRLGGNASAKAADAPAAEAAPAPAPKAKTIEKSVLVAALKDATTKAGKCGKGGSLTVSFNIKNGSATNVTAAGGSFAGSATEKCILTVFQKYNWPDGNASGIKYPVKL